MTDISRHTKDKFISSVNTHSIDSQGVSLIAPSCSPIAKIESGVELHKLLLNILHNYQ